MGRIISDGAKYYFEDDNIELLLDTQDMFCNYSALPMHYDIQKPEGGSEMFFALTDSLSKVIEKTDGGSEAFLVLSVIADMLKQYRQKKVLFAGKALPLWAKLTAQMVKLFNKDNTFYWLSDEIGSCDMSYVTPVFTVIDRFVLSEKEYDVIIFDEASLDSVLSDEILGIYIAALKAEGRLLIAANNDLKFGEVIEALPDKKLYSFDNGVLVYSFEGSLKNKRFIYENSLDAAVKNISMTIFDSISELAGAINLVPKDEYAGLIDSVAQLEKLEMSISEYLVPSDLRYRLNRLREAMIDYFMGMADLEQVEKAYGPLMELSAELRKWFE